MPQDELAIALISAYVVVSKMSNKIIFPYKC